MKTNKAWKTILHIAPIVITLIIGIALGLWQVMPPPVDEASPNYPAYQQMMENIQSMATEPRPSGSEKLTDVRAWLVGEIEGMGLAPILEDAVFTAAELADLRVARYDMTKDEWWAENRERIERDHNIHNVDDWFAYVSGADADGILRLQNILVKLEAPEAEQTVLFVAHYDSVAAGPGAGDNMLSVCAMLEAMREQAIQYASANTSNGELKTNLYFLFADGEEQFMLGARAFTQEHPAFIDTIDMVINFDTRGSRGALLLYETSPEAYAMVRHVNQLSAKPIGFSLAAAVYARMNNYTDLTVFLDHGYRGINLAAIEGVENYHRPTDTYDNLHSSTAWHYLDTSMALANYTSRNSLAGLRDSSSTAVYFPFMRGMVLMSAPITYALCGLAIALPLLYAAIQRKSKKLKITFSGVIMGLLGILSVGSALLFVEASYLFSIPLLAMAITAFLKRWPVTRIAARMVSGVVALLLWVPVLYLLWVAMVQPMLL